MKSSVYDRDFLLWTEQQADLLRAGKMSELDVEHLVEEIEELGKEQKMALQSLIRMILVHLLKLDFSPSRAPRAKWIDEVLEFRARAESRIEDTPSLNHHLDALFCKAWPQARRIVEKSMLVHGENVEIPKDCPYTLEQVLDPEFLPE